MRITNGFEYKGYTYYFDLDVEPEEVTKIFHEVRTPEGKRVDMDFTPYSHPKEDTFRKWIDLGLPERRVMNRVSVPLDDEIIEEIWNDNVRRFILTD